MSPVMTKAMTLGELTAGIPGLELHGPAGVSVTGIVYDSRRVRSGDLFAAVPGTHDDGARFIPAAIAAGAAAVLARSKNGAGPGPVITAADMRLAMGRLAARLYGRPDRELTVIAFTGTNGKTTCTYLLEAILRAAGFNPGVIGTIAYRWAGNTRPAPTTTPESVDLISIMAEMKAAGVTHVIMEASSHALDQRRLAGPVIRHAAFTNLTRDHLDYHRDLEDYYQAKKKLFTEVIAGAWAEDPAPTKAHAAVNQDDPFGARLITELAGTNTQVLGYGIASEAPVRAIGAHFTDRGIAARLIAPPGEIALASPLLGRHNLENILAAAAAALGLGIGLQEIAAGTAALFRVPGRLDPVPNNAGITVVVDYAHTPDALEHVVATMNELKRGRLITVFGCGGDRDPGKRPLMGRIAAAGSDVAVVTSDNPRTEDPEKIIAAVLAGVHETGKPEYDDASGAGYLVELDRARAIRRAVNLARPGDVILIAGKGHEDYQILGTNKIHFDDREQAAAACEERCG